MKLDIIVPVVGICLCIGIISLVIFATVNTLSNEQTPDDFTYMPHCVKFHITPEHEYICGRSSEDVWGIW